MRSVVRRVRQARALQNERLLHPRRGDFRTRTRDGYMSLPETEGPDDPVIDTILTITGSSDPSLDSLS